MTTVILYQNKRNEHKYLEVHSDGHYHNSVRQYLEWIYKKQGRVLSITKNFTGDGILHRWRKNHLNELLEDYNMIERGCINGIRSDKTI